MGWGLWYGYGLAFGGIATAKLLHFACLPLLGALVHRLTRVAAPGASPWLAVALLVAVPTVLWEATTAYADLAFTLCCTLALLAVLRLDQARAAGEPGAPWIVIAALGLGVALATKHLGLVAGAVLCPALAVLLWTRERRVGPALGAAAAVGLLALVPVLPWYVRTALATGGNPLFPELWSVLGGPADRWDAVSDAGLRRFFARFGHGRSPGALLLLPWNVTMHAARYGGAPGPLLLALLPALVLVRPARGVVTLLGVLLAWLALWASPLASFQLRWLLAAAPVAAVLAACAAARLQAVAARLGGAGAVRVARWGVAVLLVLSLPPFIALHERDRRPDWSGWLVSVAHGLPLAVVTGGQSREAYLARAVPTYRAWQWANAALPPDALVLAWSGGDHLYARRERIGAFATRARGVSFVNPPKADSAWAALRALGVTHLLIDERFLQENAMADQTWDEFAVPGAALRGRCCPRVWHDGRVGIYRVAPGGP
jgi:4-amino-4-deoxy-L-arabinose transferase-like glycosyltransferase